MIRKLPKVIFRNLTQARLTTAHYKAHFNYIKIAAATHDVFSHITWSRLKLMRILFHKICRSVSGRVSTSEAVHEHSIGLNPQSKLDGTSGLI